MGRRAHVRLDDPLAPPRARLRRAHRLFRSHDPRRSWKRPAQANSSPIGVFKRTLRGRGAGSAFVFATIAPIRLLAAKPMWTAHGWTPTLSDERRVISSRGTTI